MKVNEVVTVMASSGEYVGKLTKMDENGIVLKDPRLITFGEQGMGFASGIAATGLEDPKEMTILQAVFVTQTHEDVVKAWHRATSGLIL